jgi:hypothetical protein
MVNGNRVFTPISGNGNQSCIQPVSCFSLGLEGGGVYEARFTTVTRRMHSFIRCLFPPIHGGTGYALNNKQYNDVWGECVHGSEHSREKTAP